MSKRVTHNVHLPKRQSIRYSYRGITAFLVNYPEGIFWTKRLKDDGLGYDTVKHHFCTDAEWDAMKSPMITNNGVSAEEFEKLQKDLAKLRVEFEDFIK